MGADLSSSSHAINKKDNILGKAFVQGINGPTIYIEKGYSINFAENYKKFCLSLHHDNGANKSYLFVNGREIHKFTAKNSEITATPLCLGNISKDFSVDNMQKKKGLDGYVYDFSVSYENIAVSDLLGIHKYLMEKMA